MLINHWYWRVSVTSPKAQFWDHCLLFKALIILIAVFLKHGDLICCLGKPRTLRCLSQWLNSNSNSTTQFCQILKFKKNHNKLSLCSSCFFFQAQNIHAIIIRGVFYILAPVGLFKFKQLDVPFEKLGKRTSFFMQWVAGESRGMSVLEINFHLLLWWMEIHLRQFAAEGQNESGAGGLCYQIHAATHCVLERLHAKTTLQHCL